MLHQFTINVRLQDVEAMIEKLNAAGIYYTHYETPIAVTVTEYGYDFYERDEAEIALHIYAEEDDGADLPESYFVLIQQTLMIAREAIAHALMDEQSWEYEAEEIELGNGWVIGLPADDMEPSETALKGAQLKRINFDPQGAFGTGLHGTTQDCLRLILKRDFTGQKVADLGAGSGILSIAARLRGAASVLAVDIESVREQILYNAALNGMDEIEVIQQDILGKDATFSVDGFDCLFINIGGEETLQFIEHQRVLNHTRVNFLISGLVDWSADKTLAPFLQANYRIEERLRSDEWVTVYLTR
ncbi:50S ribosomal protein L11 methyltransferase [Ammoniphilus oxalaticus]|nr:50S ribosomal protein L11 methyltransferase [Ammoniphilus oxalaticus]